MTDETTVCPECDGTNIRRFPSERSGGDWFCCDCNDHVDDVCRRERVTGGWSKTTKRLLEADKENWP